MRKTLTVAGILAALIIPAAAMAATVDPSLIPDGTYNGVVEKVVDSKHVLVKLQNGMEAQITTDRSTVAFSDCKDSDTIKMTLIKGKVAVKQCTH